jgi:hypothetical protein
MTPEQQHELALYVRSNSPHESGHMTVQFKAGRLDRLRYLPHEMAANGYTGVLETKTPTELNKDDCVALAAGMVGELVSLGELVAHQSDDDAQQVHELVGLPLNTFAREAYEIIKENLLFFTLLNIEVRVKMFGVLEKALFPIEDKPAKLPDEIPIFTLAEVEAVYKRAELILARFPKPAGV